MTGHLLSPFHLNVWNFVKALVLVAVVRGFLCRRRLKRMQTSARVIKKQIATLFTQIENSGYTLFQKLNGMIEDDTSHKSGTDTYNDDDSICNNNNNNDSSYTSKAVLLIRETA